MPRTGSAKAIADYMLKDYWVSEGAGGYSFDIDDGGRISVDLSGLDAAGQRLARWAMASWESVADIDFVEARRGAEVTFTDGGSGAITNFRFAGTTIVGATLNVPTRYISDYGSAMDQYAFQVYLHEIGHLFGLGHPGPYDGGAKWREAVFANDSWQTTVMSYFSQTENPNVRDSKAGILTPMAADIAAVQLLYGAPDTDPTRGDTVWGYGSNLTGPLGQYFRDMDKGGPAHSNSAVSFLLRDSGGTDSIDFSGDGRPQLVRLDRFVDIINPSNQSQHAHILIERGSVIENYASGNGADRIIGNGADNVLTLGGNNDLGRGKGGDDRIDGGLGLDRLFGNRGDDVLLGGDAGDLLVGGAGRDQLDGGIGGDTLRGGGGNDRLDGGMQGDTLAGGGGRDRFVFDAGSGTDHILDFALGRDRLLLDADLLVGTNLATVLARPGDLDGETMLRFASGDRLVLHGIDASELLGLTYDILT